ncbi:2,3-bisphosphoglycerate-independent phosphoglycerate mutase [Candidatus Pacearchaeota archaeon]|nr:2,3-bisphosphoglycerate-independent phosphoglycerate mutase [Candidatus Pacearchaeota archaeon]
MKTIFIVIDGVGDKSCPELKGKTPLQAAYTPNLDFFAACGKQGLLYPISETIAPESDNALTTMLGYTTFLSRGQSEAIGSGIRLEQGDLALRTNFATISNLQEGRLIDRRVGRTLISKEAHILSKTLNKRMKLSSKYIFKPTVQHRGVLVFRGGFSDNITNTDPAYKGKGRIIAGDKLRYSEPLDEEDVTKISANIVNEFVEQSYLLLKNHPINLARQKKNLLPANILLTRDAGTEMPEIKKLGGGWLAIVYMPLEIGIAKIAGMQISSFSYPNLKDFDVYKNLYDGLHIAIDIARNNLRKRLEKYDYFYIHFKETDVPGHDGRAVEKKKMIELLDKEFFSYLKAIAEKEKIKVIITADHSTPCTLKTHSADPVPFLVYGKDNDSTKRFNEVEAAKGSIGKIYGKNVIKFITS